MKTSHHSVFIITTIIWTVVIYPFGIVPCELVVLLISQLYASLPYENFVEYESKR